MPHRKAVNFNPKRIIRTPERSDDIAAVTFILQPLAKIIQKQNYPACRILQVIICFDVMINRLLKQKNLVDVGRFLMLLVELPVEKHESVIGNSNYNPADEHRHA